MQFSPPPGTKEGRQALVRLACLLLRVDWIGGRTVVTISQSICGPCCICMYGDIWRGV